MTAQAVPAFVTYRQAVDGLKRLLTVSTGTALTSLYSLRFPLRCANILAAIAPEKYQTAAAGLTMCPLSEYDQSFEHAMRAALQSIAPFDEDAMEMDGFYGPDEIALWPQPLGFPMSWDDWEEMTENVADMRDQGPSMRMYLLFTSLRLGEVDKFLRICQAYNWDLTYPRTNDLHGWDLDWERMYRLLDQAGLSDFKTAWDVCSYSTNNFYFDWNPGDEGRYDDFGVFDVDGFRFLADEFRRAQPIQDIFFQAQMRFLQDPDIPGRLVEIYRKSLVKSPGRDSGPRIEIRNASDFLAGAYHEAGEEAPDIEEAGDLDGPFGPFDDEEDDDDTDFNF